MLVGNTILPSKLTFELLPAEVQDVDVLYKAGQEDSEHGEHQVNTDLYKEGHMKWE